MTMGEIIKNHRLRLGFSQQELGEMVGVNKAAVQKWESGTVKNIKKATIEKLSIIFKITPSELMGWPNDSSSIDAQFITSSFQLTQKEMKIISSYREHPEMHNAVHRILGITEDEPNYRLVAYGGDNEDKKRKSTPHIT